MKTLRSEAQPAASGSRRTFLRRLGAIAGAGMVHAGLAGRRVHGETSSDADREICGKKFEVALREKLAERPIGEIMVAVGTSFLGTPYEAGTLEREGPEGLIVNLRALDCVTFVETTLALSRCIRGKRLTFEEYGEQLTLIRYRGGKINGYESRLHYFSDWMADNETKRVVRDISRELGGAVVTKTIGFMSAHPSSYPQLADKSVLARIGETERRLNETERWFIPRDKLAGAKDIEPGDIIAITTAVEGLDVAHTGIAVRVNGLLRYLHAPLSGGEVQISEESLAAYLAERPKHTGIMVARPLEPQF